MSPRVRLALVLSAVVTAACATTDASITGLVNRSLLPAVVTVDSGSGQADTVAHTLPVSATVHVQAADGTPLAGIPVVFRSGGSPVTVYTTTAGQAAYPWTLSTQAGVQTLQAQVDTLPVVNFVAQALPGYPTTLKLVAGDSQAAVTGTPIPIPPTVLVTDAYGNPVPQIAVRFAIGTGGGVLVGDTATTDASGRATVGLWTLGAASGPNALVVSTVPGIAPITVYATAIPPSVQGAARIIVFAGNNQIAAAGTAVGVPPVLQVLDGTGAPVANALVSFGITRGVGSITTATAHTDNDGLVSPGTWTLGTRPDTNVLTAAVSGATVAVSAIGVVGRPTYLTVVNGNGQTGNGGAVLPALPTVRVTDAFNNPVTGLTVVFALASGGGSLAGGLTLTDCLGIATSGTWTLGPVQNAAATAMTVTVSAGTLTVILTATALP